MNLWFPLTNHPDKLSELEIKALLERYENQCEAKKKALAKRHKWSLWMALQRCIRHKANVRYIPYDMKPDPGGTKTRLTSKRLSNLPLLPEDHESEYRKGCEEWCKTQKKKRDECIEDCIRRREGDRGFHYKPKVNPERAEADDAS
ncbi:hypothetical protein AX14_012643 [Amanita brunnescens Koide BX004]|nr:hypothetical protein AX14_012643 [Amanita brunnescens Koide BX004]